MNRDDIIRMAREAGFDIERVVAVYPDGSRTVTVAPVKELERFAALVAAHEREANLQQIEIIVEAEREACAKLCETMKWCDEGKFFAHWIRARGDLP